MYQAHSDGAISTSTYWRVHFNEAFKLWCVGIAGQLLYSKLL